MNVRNHVTDYHGCRRFVLLAIVCALCGACRAMSAPGSRGFPVESSLVVHDDGSASGECPFCAETMQLGYADLPPIHEPRSTAV